MPAPPKRVLLMISSMRGGGSERQVLLLAQSLDRSRFAPHLYLTEAAGDFLDHVPNDVPIHAFDSCPDKGGIYLPGRQLRRQTEFLRGVIRDNRIDVVYDRTFHMTLLAGKAAGNVRRVSTIVSPPHLALPFVEKRFVAIKRRRLADAYRRSDVVVAVSKQAAMSAESYYGLPPGIIQVVKNPVDLEQLAAVVINKPAPSATPSQETPNQTLLVCVGRMTEEKGHSDLIAAIANLTDRWPKSRGRLALRLIGDGPLRPALESQVSSLGLTDRIEFIGALDSALVQIADADALVLPSRFEGMPNVVLEAMALGTPVIATKAGGTIELQRDMPTAFWANPGDPESIADAILSFAKEPGTAAAHRAAAFDLVTNEHNLKQTVRRIEDLLDGS
ncbi:MAG: glycosyltransferase [Planctomycetales bacterium]|nr:glycosyltransferase [Planctomycetales bacterium]